MAWFPKGIEKFGPPERNRENAVLQHLFQKLRVNRAVTGALIGEGPNQMT
jgi:hypothetical protein